MTDPAPITAKTLRKPRRIGIMKICLHKFERWRPVDRDEIGGQTLVRYCMKCQHKQIRFASNVSPLAD